MHFWTLLEMLSAGLCWPFTVTETRASTIMASLITARLFFVTASKASNAMRNISETRNAIIILVRGLICLPLPSGPDVLLVLLPQSFSDLKANMFAWWKAILHGTQRLPYLWIWIKRDINSCNLAKGTVPSQRAVNMLFSIVMSQFFIV